MTRRPLILLVLVVLLLASVAFYSAAQEAQNTNSKDSGSSPIMFIENAGQWEAGARFQARGGGTILWLADDALWLTMVEQSTDDAANSRVDPPARFGPNRANAERANESRRASNIKVSFVGANPHPPIETFDRLDTVVSYFIGNDPAQWRPDVPVWGGVRYVDLYPGVDLEITSENGQLVQRLAARPHTDLAVVQLQVEGVDAVTADGDVLRLSTAVGDAILPMLRVDGLQVAGAQVQPRGTQAFRIAAPFAVSRSNPSSRPAMSEDAGSATANPAPQGASSPQSLAANPADVLYATFLGGSGSEYGMGIAVDGAGSAYVAGYTSSTDFPITPGAFDTSYSEGGVDAFVVKLDAAGSGLTYATFLGGSGDDGSFDITVDGAGSAFVAGVTSSTDFPTTAGAFDTSYSGGSLDAFVAKLDAAGSGLTYATFLGGSGDEYVWGLAVDGAGSAYVAGNTSSIDFPTTAGAFDTSYGGGSYDAYVAKLDAAGSGLTYATFLGGSGDELGVGMGMGIAVDGGGSAYVAGSTSSTDFPTTPGAFDTSYGGDSYDAYVAKLDAAGSGLTYATFLGGSGNEASFDITVDGAGSAFVAGATSSTDFPTTAGAFDTSYSEGGVDAFVAKLDAAGSGLTYVTFLGGSGDEYGMGIAVDGAGSAFVVGYTSSTDFPTTAGAFDTSYSGGSYDAYVAKLDAAGSGLTYATFLGGSGDEYGMGMGIAVDGAGSAYVTGNTSSTDFPTTAGAFDTSYGGGSWDAFAVKFAAGLESDDVVQVTNTNGDNNPTLVQASDGKLWLFFNSYRDNGFDYLWSQTSIDGGATWSSATAFTQIFDDDYDPAAASSDDGKLYVVWRRTEGGNNIWFRSSADNGATWSTATRLTIDPAGDYSPDIIHSSDGKLWVVWQSNRTGNDDIWYKTSTDDGATWSPDTQLTTSTESEILPTIAQAADGKIWIVWTRSGGLWYQTSDDGGTTWASEAEISDTCCYDHYANLVAAQDGTLWLADERAGDIWYRTSADNGASWSTATAYTRYIGSDVMPEVVALADGQVAFAWHSDRGQQWWSNIWYGVFGTNADINPPPSVGWINVNPGRPDSNSVIAVCVEARDESSGLGVELVWQKDGVPQDNLPMYDDGLHGDGSAGDSRWGALLGPFPAGTTIASHFRTQDSDGNVIFHPIEMWTLQVIPIFVKTTDILFVPDNGGSDTAGFRSYYTNALDSLGYTYDTWDTGLRGSVPADVLNQYTAGRVIWSVPDWGYLTNDFAQRMMVRDYLSAGGKLFITGQNIGQRLSGDSLLTDYLHATYVQDDTGLYALSGAAGDPTGDGLALNLSGGDGADNQGSKDEVDPVSPAVTAFTYQSGSANLQAVQARPSVGRTNSEEAGRPAPAPASTPAPGVPVVHPTPQVTSPSGFRSAIGEAQTTLARPAVSKAQSALFAAVPEANISSGTAGLRVDTGTYKVVYFAFGFEGINNASQRAAVMERVLSWLNGTPPRPGLLAPADGRAVPVGDVGFSWVGAQGVTSYQIQIDSVPTFDSAGLIDQTVTATSYTHNLNTLGTRYWRVRALPDGDWTAAWRFIVAGDVVQVTTDVNTDERPSLVRTSDGKLLVVWSSYRSGNSDLWYRISGDDGATWSADTQLTTDSSSDACPAITQASDGRLWVVWYSYHSGNAGLWYKTSTDGGATWSTDTQLIMDPSAYYPAIAQANDGKLWVVWYSYHSGNLGLWYKSTPDGGVTWSTETQLTTEYSDYPTIAQAGDGKLWVVWHRNGNFWYRTSADAGKSWSTEALLYGDCCLYHPSLAMASNGVFWLAGGPYGDVWLRSSSDDGATWNPAARLTRFTGPDELPALAPLADGKIAVAWQSIRSGNPDIWFGIPGEREDLNPPPYVDWIEHQPWPNATGDDTITFRARAMDETGVANVELVWTLDGAAQADLPMYDDGAHGDDTAGDGIWGAQHAPLPVDSQVTYHARATDLSGNTYLYPNQGTFMVLAPFAKMAELLFVPDYGGNDTSWFRPYYTNALDALGYTYDVWDTGLRGEPAAAVLSQYSTGAIIWGVPYWGYITNDSNQRAAVQAYLEAGGKLFIAGQNIAEDLNWNDGTAFLNNYLHATYEQGDTGLYGLSGAAGDPIGDELVLNLSGGDGANDQYSKDEIDPIGPAVAVFTYQTGASAMLKEPVRSAQEAPRGDVAPAGWLAGPGGVPSLGDEAAESVAAPEANISSGTAGLRVDTGTYQVVYFAFGFEGINNVSQRAAVMERALAWLGGVLPRPGLVAPTDGQAVPVGDVAFSWAGVPGATGYQTQIDTVPTFDSTGLIDETVTETTYTDNFTTLGTRYWRVRALPDGDWTAAWTFAVAGPLVQVTTDTNTDYWPAMTRTSNGTLWVVWYSYRSGNPDLWYKTSSDGGATWTADTQLTTDGNTDYYPAVTQTADGTLWVVWSSYRSGNADLWYKTSTDGGATWSIETQLTTDGNTDFYPAVTQAADGTLWVAWTSYRSGNYDLWYKTTANGGVTWSADTQLTTHTGTDYYPAMTWTSDGRLWVVWSSSRSGNYDLWYKTTANNGVTWSADTQHTTDDNVDRYPAMVQADDGTYWVVWSSNRSGAYDLWYKTSSDDGATWSSDMRFTRFAGLDYRPALASLTGGKIGVAWYSNRSGNYDIWYGIPGEREDLDPPPYISSVQHQPSPNPENDDTISFRAWAQDETGVASVDLAWTLNGVEQSGLSMFDDGLHGDDGAGDGGWGVQLAPLPAGTQVCYHVRATDIDGNTYTSGQNCFTVLTPFVKTAEILLVPDYGGNDTTWFQPYFTNALDTLGYTYDIWDTGFRGVVPGSILNQYVGGSVIWGAPYSGYITDNSSQRTVLQDYLAAGGKLFISGQNLAARLSGNAFLTGYLHASYVQDDTGLYELAGMASDPIGDGLALNLSGGDGAGNQYTKDEIDPISPAETIFTYLAGSSQSLAEPSQLTGLSPTDLLDPHHTSAPDEPDPALQPDIEAEPLARAAAAPEANISSGTAGLRVDTGTYKVVYFAFGFEGINRTTDRARVMGRVLDWFGMSPSILSRDLTIQKSLAADAGSAEPGATVTYKLAYANLGNQSASNVTITDILPTGMEYVSAIGPVTPNVAGQVVTWNLGTLPRLTEPAASGVILITVKIAASAPVGSWLDNAAEISTSDTETDGTGSGLTGSYYEYDGDAIGVPPNDPFGNGVLKLRRVDPTVDFDWGEGSPQSGIVHSNWFAVRWTGYVYAPLDGTYTFATVTDDGARLWVDNQQLVDDWTQHGMETRSGQIVLTGGQWYAVQFDTEEGGGGAGARLQWQLPGSSSLVTIPQRYLSPEAGFANDSSILGFSVAPPLKTSDLLLVLDYGGNDTDWFRPYYTASLSELGYSYDVWDTEALGAPQGWVLDRYLGGAVIWTAPYWGYIIYPDTFSAVQSYLDQGGRLFLTSQDTGYYLNEWGNTGFLNAYLHATYVQDSTVLYAVTGVSSDLIGDGLVLSLSGGDGASNQGDTDEFDSVSPATPVFTYGTGGGAAAAAGTGDELARSLLPQILPTPPDTGQKLVQADVSKAAGLEGNISSGTAGLRVDTGTYKVVYFGFGFEGINSRADRNVVMERTMAWLRGVTPNPTLLAPADGVSLPAGDVTFSWRGETGVNYEIQIDTAPSFDSPELIGQTVTSTSYVHNFTTLGTRYWRVRALPGGDWTAAWDFTVAGNVVQVTTDAGGDYDAAIVQAADGKLWVVWHAYRSGNDDLWYRTSADDGTTWSTDTQLTTDGNSDYGSAIAQAADGKLWVAWYSYRSGSPDIWAKYTADGGVTWSTDVQLTTDANSDYNPAVAQGSDGKVWVVWYSYRSGNADIWGKYTDDGGDTWSTDLQLTADTNSDYYPTIIQGADGKLWLAWRSNRSGSTRIWYKTSTDGGSTWSADAMFSTGSSTPYYPTLAATPDGALWLGWYSWGPGIPNAYYSQNTDVWYMRSADHGVTWSIPTRLTSFTGLDQNPSFAAGPGGSLTAVWQSDRAANWDVWFGILGQREDVNPPPHIDEAVHIPAPNPDDTQAVTIRALLSDNTGIASASAPWTVDGVPQIELALYDDGSHNDYSVGDGWYGTVPIGPYPAGTVVDYSVRITDVDGNAVEGDPTSKRFPTYFVVQPHFVSTASLLLVADNRNGDPSYEAQFYTRALDSLAVSYDVWNTYLRGVPDSAVLSHYSAVIWAMPDAGVLLNYPEYNTAIPALQGYLDSGGKLFISGQQVGQMDWYGDAQQTFHRNYLHAQAIRSSVGIYNLAGQAGDPISDGLSPGISGGDGANNQYYQFEIDPLAPATTVFTYLGLMAAAEQAMPVVTAFDSSLDMAQLQAALPREGDGAEPWRGVELAPQLGNSPSSVASSGSAAVRVDTGTYKVVYFAFGFEAINSEADRNELMRRAMEWFGFCVAPAAPTGVTIRKENLDAVLGWDDAGAASYEVAHAANAPYFTPADTCTAPDCEVVTTNSYRHVGAFGTTGSNYFYAIRAVNICGSKSDVAQRVGGFSFDLVPGLP